MPNGEESQPWRLTDKERLLLLEKNIKQLLKDHSSVVQAVEQLQKMVRALEDYKLSLTTRIDTVVSLLKLIGAAQFLNIVADIVLKYWK